MKAIENNLTALEQYAEDQCTSALLSYHLTKEVCLILHKLEGTKGKARDDAFATIAACLAEHIDEVKKLLTRLDNFKMI